MTLRDVHSIGRPGPLSFLSKIHSRPAQLSPHIHPVEECIFQVIPCVLTCLLRPRVLFTPLFSVIRNGYIALLPLGHWSCGRGCWLLSNMCSESHNLVQNHLPHLLYIFHDLESEVEGLWACWLIGCVMPDVQIAVLKSFFNRYPRGGIESEHTIQKIKRVWVCLWEQSLERNFGHEWQVADVFLRSWGSNS